jgi:hypothetical protein
LKIARYVLGYRDPKNLRRAHLLIEELDDPDEIRGKAVGDKEHPNVT